MAHHQVDRALDELDSALTQLRCAIAGIPARRQGFKADHDRVARSMATVAVELDYARSAVTD